MTREEIEKIVMIEVHSIAQSDEMTRSVFLDDNLDDIDLDDIDRIEIMINLQDKFDIYIEDNDEYNWQTVRDIVDCVERLVKS